MKTLQQVWLASLALLVASALPIHAQDRGRGAPRQLEQEEQAANDRARDDDRNRENQDRDANRDHNRDGNRDWGKRDDQPEWGQRNGPEWRGQDRGPQGQGNHPQDGRYNDPNYGPYNGPYGGGYNGPYGGGYNSYRVMAEAVIQHEDPNRVNAELGAVGEPFRPISVRFREDSYDIVRKRGWEQGRHNPHDNNNYRRTATVEVELSRYVQWMDGRREWFLRIDDRSREGGQLLSFTIRTDRGTYSVRNVPAYFGPNRRLEARVTPIANGGNYQGGGYNYPYPDGGGYNYPYPDGGGYNYPSPNSYQNTVVRSMPRNGYVGQRISLQYTVRTGYGNLGRIEVTEVLPPTGWQVVGASPQPRYIDQRGGRVTWDLVGPRDGTTLRLDVIIPRIDGGQRFKGTFRFDGGAERSIDGERDIYIGDNYYSDYPYGTGGGYNQPSYGAPIVAEILGTILGLPTGINGQ